MSDMNYGISVELENGLKSLKEFETAVSRFDKGREAALKLQLDALKKMEMSYRNLNKIPIKASVQFEEMGVEDRNKLYNDNLNKRKSDVEKFLKSVEKENKEHQDRLLIQEKSLTNKIAKEKSVSTQNTLKEARSRIQKELEILKQKQKPFVNKLKLDIDNSGIKSLNKFYRDLEKSSNFSDVTKTVTSQYHKLLDQEKSFSSKVIKEKDTLSRKVIKDLRSRIQKEVKLLESREFRKTTSVPQPRDKDMKEGLVTSPDIPSTTKAFHKKRQKERDALHAAAIKENNRRDAEAAKVKENLFKKEQKEFDLVQEAITKRLKVEEKERTRVVLSEAKARIKARQEQSKQQSSRRVQAVAQITAPTGAKGMAKYYRDLEKFEAKRLAQLEQAKAEIMSSTFMMKKQVTSSERLLQNDIKAAVLEAKEGKALRNKVRMLKNSTAELRKQHFLMSRMNSSAKEFAGNYVSAFAAAAVGTSIMQTGQDFERAENTLTALFQSSEKASEEMEYLRDLTFSMGIPLRETSKDYAKLLASVGENLPLSESKQLFENLSKASVVMGTSAEDTSGILKALSQMLAKQKIQAEEYRGQLGDRMPIALQAMTKAAVAAGVITDELTAKYGSQQAAMEKLMEQGKLYSADVLPFFGEEIRKVVEPGLEKALQSNMNALGRLQNVIENTLNLIFKSGFGEGLTELFNNTSQFFKQTSDLWKALGAILGSVFKAVAAVVKVLTPVFSALGVVLKAATDLLGGLSAAILIVFRTIVGKITGIDNRLGRLFSSVLKGKNIFEVMTKAIKRLGLGLLLPLALLEELVLFFRPDPNKKTFFGTDVEQLFGGIEEMVAKMLTVFKPIQDFFSTMFDNIRAAIDYIDSDGIGNGELATPYNMRNYQQSMQIPYPSIKSDVNINLTSEVHLDSEKVGSGVANTRAFREGVNQEVSNSMLPNY